MPRKAQIEKQKESQNLRLEKEIDVPFAEDQGIYKKIWSL